MIFSRIYQIMIGALGIGCLILYLMLQQSIKNNEILKVNNIKLEESLIVQTKTIDYLRESTIKSNENIGILVKSNNTINDKLNSSLQEVQSLRSTEAKRAIENPYERGNFATNMLSKRLQSITGQADTNTDKDSPSSTNPSR